MIINQHTILMFLKLQDNYKSQDLLKINYNTWILDKSIKKMSCESINATSLLLSTGEYIILHPDPTGWTAIEVYSHANAVTCKTSVYSVTIHSFKRLPFLSSWKGLLISRNEYEIPVKANLVITFSFDLRSAIKGWG